MSISNKSSTTVSLHVSMNSHLQFVQHGRWTNVGPQIDSSNRFAQKEKVKFHLKYERQTEEEEKKEEAHSREGDISDDDLACWRGEAEEFTPRICGCSHQQKGGVNWRGQRMAVSVSTSSCVRWTFTEKMAQRSFPATAVHALAFNRAAPALTGLAFLTPTSSISCPLFTRSKNLSIHCLPC